MKQSIKGITIEIGGDTTRLETVLNKSRSTAKSLQTELNFVNKALKLDPTNVDLVRQKKILLKNAIEETKNKLDIMKQAQDEADRLMQNGVEIDQEEYRKLQREIAFAQNKLESYTTELTTMGGKLEEIGNKATKFGDNLSNIGGKLMPVSGTVTALGSASAVMASSFEDSMAKVSTIADTTEVPMEDLEDEILKLSNDSGIAASEIADNVYNAISAGQKTGDAVNFVSNATDLARAGFADTGASLDVLTTIMNAYGLEASQVTDVSDMLIQTQNLGKTTVAELASSMGKVIPTANAMGVGLDNLTAAYTITTANGIQTAESTTYINSMLNELGKSSTTVGKILKEKTGKSFQELMEDGSSLGDVLGILEESAEESGTAFNEIWSSAEAGKAAMSLLSDGAEGFNDRLAEMQASSGATETAIGKLDTTSHKIQVTINKLKNTMIDLGKELLRTLAPIIDEVSEKVSEFAEWFKALDDNQKQTIVRIGLIVAAAAPLLTIAGKLISTGGSILTTGSKMIGGVKNLVTHIGLAKTATDAATTSTLALNTAFLTSPVTWLVVALAGLTGAIIYLNQKNKEAIEAEYGLTDAQEEHIEKINDEADAYKQMEEARQDAMSGISEEYGYLERLKDELNGLIDSNGEVKAGYEDRANFIINELSQALGMEEEEIRDIIAANGELGDSIDDLIEKKKAQAILNANEEAYQTAIQNSTGALSDYIQAQADYAEALEKVNQLTEEGDRLMAEGDMMGLESLKEKLEVAQGALEEESEALKTAESTYVGYQTTIQNYEGLSASIISGDAQKINEALLYIENGFITTETGSKESLQRQVTEMRTKCEEMKTALAEGMPGVTQESVNQMENLVNLSVAELAKLEGYSTEEGQAAAVALATGIESQKEMLTEGGAKLAGAVVEGVEEVDTYPAGEEKAEEAAEGAASAQGDFQTIGSQWSQGLANGMAAFNISSTVSNIANTVLNTMKRDLDIHSPSRKAYSIGGYFMQGLINSVTDNTKTLAQKCSEAAGEMLGAVSEETKDADNLFDGSMTLRTIQSIVQPQTPAAALAGAAGAGGNVNYITNSVEIHADKVDREHIGEIAEEINRLLGSRM